MAITMTHLYGMAPALRSTSIGGENKLVVALTKWHAYSIRLSVRTYVDFLAVRQS